MDDSYASGILHLAKLKMGLPPVNSQPEPFSILVTLGNQQCILTHEELKTNKLNLPQNLNKIIGFNSNDCKEFQNSNKEQPLDFSVKRELSTDVETQENGQTSLDQIKIEKIEYEDATNHSLSNGSEMLDNTSDEQVTSEQYYPSTESNDSLYLREQVSTKPGSSKEPGEKMEVAPEASQISTSATENRTMVDDSTKVEERNEEHTSRVDLRNNQRHNSNHSAQNYYSLKPRRMCYFCHELVFHSAWNCPKRREERDKNKFSPWASSSSRTTWKSQHKPYQGSWQRNNHFNNARTNFSQKNNAPAKRGTFRRVYEMLQNSNQIETKNRLPQTKQKSTIASSTETGSHHKIQFKGEWYTNRIAADAELYLNKKEEVSHQIKKEHRELDEGFEDIQQVLSDDEYPNENPMFVYNKLQKHFKDEDNDPGGSSASFSTAA